MSKRWWAIILGAAVMAQATVRDSILGWQASADVHANLTSSMPVPDARLITSIADKYGGNWYALSIPASVGTAWDTLPAMAELDLSARRKNAEVRLVLPIRRDLESWMDDPAHGNWVTSANDLDINIPYEGWLAAKTPVGDFKVGRFRYRYSPTAHGVILAGAPRHDGLLWDLPLGRLHYTFFGDWLNPSLNGTATDSSGQVAGSGTSNVESTFYPTGSEAWQQSHLALGDQYGKIYSDPYKTYFLHSLGILLGPLDFSIVEQTLIGGKAPQFRDLNPFILWHNNYGDGYSRSFFSFDARVNGGAAGFFWGQLSTQLIRSPIGEEGYDPATQAAIGLGWSDVWIRHRGTVSASFDFASTTPTYDNHLLPLLRMTSRQTYHSNYRSQNEAYYADVYEVDYPIGYQRGPDAMDFWTQLSWESTPNALGSRGAGLEFDFLQQGDADLDTSSSRYTSRNWPLSGIVERELRTILEVHRTYEKYWQLSAGLGFSAIWNLNHRSGNFGLYPLWSGSIGFRY